MTTERITLQVVVEINYQNYSERKEAIAKAKDCVTSGSILSVVGAKPIKATLIQEKKQH